MDTGDLRDIDRARPLRRRRTAYFGLVLLTASLATGLMIDIVTANGLTTAEGIGIPLFFALIGWLAASFWTAIAGFVIRIRGGDPVALSLDRIPDGPLRGRTALVVCIHEEEVARVSAGIAAIWTSLGQEREADAFDLFVLSDTQRRDVAAEEEEAWRAWTGLPRAEGRIFYRRRPDRSGRKAGNVADFVRRWGGAYDFMLVLDADSVMSGKAIVTLARLMDAHPEIGIIQSLPMPAGSETLFARMIQFAARLYSPMLASGLSFWQLGDSNYWGHNAIIRIRTFAKHCGLPVLAGEPPLGGEILSHDFVEAAFMRRAGQAVWLLPDLEGSWERIPTNVIDYAIRDRRWVQGNLQHLRVLPARGLHWMTRVHLLTGVMAYVSSLLWLATLVLSTITTCVEAVRGPVYFEHGAHSLFPTWPESREFGIAVLLASTIVLLLLPKLLGVVLALRDPRLREGFGGPLRLALSALADQAFSVMLAPMMMVFHSVFVVRIACGRASGWDAQARGDRSVSWREAWRRHRGQLALGLGWGAIVWTWAPLFVGWLAPVLLGLLVSIPLSVVTSRATIGRRWRTWGLFVTPEEFSPPLELAAALRAKLEVSVLPWDGVRVSSVPPLAILGMEPAVLSPVTPRAPMGRSEAVVRGSP